MELKWKLLESRFRGDINKNYYAISFVSSGCNFEILVNDVLVWRYFGEGAETGLYPINPEILNSGEQRIKVKLYPVKGHEEKGINSEHPLSLTVYITKKLPHLSIQKYTTY